MPSASTRNPTPTGRAPDTPAPAEPLTRRRFVVRAAGAASAVVAASALPAPLPAAAWARVPGANDRLCLGVIGTGVRGRQVMAAFLKQPEVQIVTLCDVYDVALNEARAQFGAQAAGARTAADYRQVLGDRDVDAVLIATPDHWHATMAVDACRAEKDVYSRRRWCRARAARRSSSWAPRGASSSTAGSTPSRPGRAMRSRSRCQPRATSPRRTCRTLWPARARAPRPTRTWSAGTARRSPPTSASSPEYQRGPYPVTWARRHGAGTAPAACSTRR